MGAKQSEREQSFRWVPEIFSMTKQKFLLGGRVSSNEDLNLPLCVNRTALYRIRMGRIIGRHSAEVA